MTTCRYIANGLTLIAVILLSSPFDVSSFTFSRIKPLANQRSIAGDGAINANESRYVLRFDDLASISTQCNTRLLMANDEGQGGGSTSIIAGILLLIFVAGSVVPILGTFGMKGEMSIADSVVTRQDAPEKLQNFESKQYSLSRSAIQEKLNSVPVFYIATTGDDGYTTMGTDIYMSYDDAKAASAGPSSSSVKGTTLDQVMYPLVLKRGRMRMAPPPVEVERAEGKILDAGKADSPSYRLIPSKVSVQQAKELNLKLSDSDFPLFVADRLAFGSPKGPQLPLFLDKNDCITSYNRLRQGKSSLPEVPNIRTSTFLETLVSMERGSRPGVSQISFYATADDLLQLTEMLSK
mmetsp:Transcript_10585/g.25491  ORF Transcript_10585/g.25491 Transcript_10585/m.25491 type:complete len:351 (-) Transcript_10585:400-1452(-)|eukprot:CAMPEP_0197181964 /NCGR_PEP_ID=MMETSP1423-20130617/6086_1 /TAXON_ID=476441 /ORGANISM="Pseudo-nitzschia heimii, Strain UNC1101" /LENGTH=350 /DNA_ID=CAMNT_0042632317 /DNA_START=38 /DNA_END=1090 /DNA_ORIENTATION=-